MKVIHLINYTGGGGTENYIFSLIEKLHKKNCEIIVVYNEVGDGLERFKDYGVEMIHLPMKSSYDIGASRELKNICRDKNIDIVHTHFLRENYIALLSKFLGNKVKVVNTRHMLDRNQGLVKYFNRFMMSFNHSIIAVSQAVRELLYEEIGKKDSIELIYTGVDSDYWKPNDDRSFRDQYKLDDDVLLISSTARFSKEKGYDFLIRAIKDFKSKLDYKLDYRFVLVGNGSELDRMKKLSQELGVYEDIIFTGYRSDIKSILNQTDIFLSMSKLEAFGISIIEAMSMKLPIMATRSGGPNEIIEDGQDGILIDYGDLDSFSHNLLRLSSDKKLRDNYASRGYQKVLDNFTLDETARRTYELYKK